MSVTTVLTPTVQRGLMQLNSLDPETLLLFGGTVVADGSGGVLTASLVCPNDLSVIWISLGGFLTGTTSLAARYAIILEAANIFRSSVVARVVGGTATLEQFEPPRIMLNPQIAGGAASASIVTGNTNTEDLNVEAMAFAWEAQAGRNVPQRFFWPATLA